MSALMKPRPLRAPSTWPTPEQLQQMGFVKCATETCRTYLDPVNVRSTVCQSCSRAQRDKRRADRFQHRARIRQAA